MTYIKSNKRRI